MKKDAFPWQLILMLVQAIGCPIARDKCPTVFAKKDCDAALAILCP